MLWQKKLNCEAFYPQRRTRWGGWLGGGGGRLSEKILHAIHWFEKSTTEPPCCFSSNNSTCLIKMCVVTRPLSIRVCGHFLRAIRLGEVTEINRTQSPKQQMSSWARFSIIVPDLTKLFQMIWYWRLAIRPWSFAFVSVSCYWWIKPVFFSFSYLWAGPRGSWSRSARAYGHFSKSLLLRVHSHLTSFEQRTLVKVYFTENNFSQ